MTYSIGKLARMCGLSRSTLLYYDSIGLLTPSRRSESRYRLYSEKDKNRLEQICTYRQMGVPLEEIRQLLEMPGSRAEAILENHLVQLSTQIRLLRKQQQAIVQILRDKKLPSKAGIMDKDTWIGILRSTGMNDEDMMRWHREFEKSSPQAHHDFLATLGMNERQIRIIRSFKEKT